MSSIKKEIPTGAIDGVNKVFLLANAPSQVDDVFMDGAIYVSFTVVGNVLTLSDAPTLSLYVDYDYAGGSSVVDTTVTFGEIIQEVWDLLGQTSNSTVFSRSKVGKKINEKVLEVCRGRVKPLIQGMDVIRAGDLWFRNGIFGIRSKSGSELTADFAVGDVSISCDTTNMLPSGYAQIGGETFKYTSVNSTSLLGVTGGTVAHVSGEKVVQLYAAPLNFDRSNALFLTSPGQYGKQVEIPLDQTEKYATYYSVIRYGTLQLLKISGVPTDSVLNCSYSVKINPMSYDADVCPIPDDYGTTVIAPLVAGEMSFVRGMPNGATILTSAYSSLRNMYQFFTNVTNVVKQSIKPQSYKFASVNRPAPANR